ncbi:hypothetical protein [Flavobacterium sp. SM2513]|uniref:hypothetical protein n=1 Tax=Flavobacterium sp. SM2513 TaxID=3424766 RepID=UPI003D7FDCD9
MKNLLKIVFLALITSNCCQAQFGEDSEKKTKQQTFKIAVLKTNTYRGFESFKPAKLSTGELDLLEYFLLERIEYYNKYKAYQKISLKNYNRQYAAAINPKGEKVVFINCFCEHRATNWKKVLNEVDDGGNCFFTLNVNLTLRTAEELDVNGI